MAESPEDALALLESGRFDLVVSDINLNAEQNGLDLLRAFKARDPEVEVVLISAFGTLETALEAVKAGAFDYVSKPVDIGQVRSVVARALARRARAGGAPRPFVPGRTGGAGRPRRPQRGHARRLQADRPRLLLRRPRARDRRDRHRQGAGGPRHPPPRLPGLPRLRARQLRGAARGAARVRALRPPAGGLHRRRRRQEGPLRGGPRRHDLPRRDRRDVAGVAGPPPARARARRGAPGRRLAGDERRRARHRGHPPRPRARGPGGPLPAGSLLPAPRLRRPRSALARAPRGRAPSRDALPGGFPGQGPRRGLAQRGRPRRTRRATTGRATSASSRTRSSGSWRRRAAGRSTSPTCRPPSRSGPPPSRSLSSPASRASRRWRSATSATCWPRSRATAAAPRRSWASTAARSTAWPSASGSTSGEDDPR